MTTRPEPAWVLSQQPYGNSGRLVELFTAQHGRLGVIARGVHRKNHGGTQSQFLQVFYPLLVQWSGRGELKQLTRVEAAGVALRPVGRATLCGQYLNELILRLLPRFDAHPALFSHYGSALEAIVRGDLEPALRRFEILLLNELGYPIDWTTAADEQPLCPEVAYDYQPGRGWVLSRQHTGLLGRDVMAAGLWLVDEVALASPALLRGLKIVCRQALAPLLGDRPLQTREMARQIPWEQSK